MKMNLFAVATLTFALSMAYAADKKEELKAEIKAGKEAVNSSCAADAKTAGCEGKEFGKGLLKCLHAYKKEHKDFEVSAACKDATKQLREDRKEIKAERKEAKEERKKKKENK